MNLIQAAQGNTRRCRTGNSIPAILRQLTGAIATIAATDGFATSEAPAAFLPVGTSAAVPWSIHPAWFLVLSLILAAAVWAGCAWKRALDEDPNRLRRAGLRELRRLLASLRRSQSGPAPQHLHAWLRAAARTWNVSDAAPTCDQVTGALFTCTSDARLSGQWRDLWCATERSLFAAERKTPADWIELASRATAEVRLPRRTYWFPNKLKHWLPVTLAAVIFTVCIPDPSIASISEGTAIDRYTQASSAASEPVPVRKAARRALASDWNDWAAHYNLATASMQAGDLNTAIGHATAAFVQQPGSRAVRNNLRQTLQQFAEVDPTLRRLLFGAVVQRLPTLASPAVWQRVALLASLLLATGLGVSIVTLYRPAWRRSMLLAGAGIGMTGVVMLSIAVTGWNAYGDLSQPAAAIVIQAVNLSPAPTDLVPEEETIPVLQGSAVVQMNRSFLGWQQIRAGRDQGWVRRSVLLPLYADGGS